MPASRVERLTAIHHRTGPCAKLIREAATTDPEIADVLRDTSARQRSDVGAGLELVLGFGPSYRRQVGGRHPSGTARDQLKSRSGAVGHPVRSGVVGVVTGLVPIPSGVGNEG